MSSDPLAEASSVACSESFTNCQNAWQVKHFINLSTSLYYVRFAYKFGCRIVFGFFSRQVLDFFRFSSWLVFPYVFLWFSFMFLAFSMVFHHFRCLSIVFLQSSLFFIGFPAFSSFSLFFLHFLCFFCMCFPLSSLFFFHRFSCLFFSLFFSLVFPRFPHFSFIFPSVFLVFSFYCFHVCSYIL